MAKSFFIKEDVTIVRVANLKGFVVFALITIIIGGVIGFFVNKHESIEMGLLLGGLFGIAYCISSLIVEIVNK